MKTAKEQVKKKTEKPKMGRPLQGKPTTHIRIDKMHVRAIDDLGKYLSTHYAKELSEAGVKDLSKSDIIGFMLDATSFWMERAEQKEPTSAVMSPVTTAVLDKNGMKQEEA